MTTRGASCAIRLKRRSRPRHPGGDGRSACPRQKRNVAKGISLAGVFAAATLAGVVGMPVPGGQRATAQVAKSELAAPIQKSAAYAPDPATPTTSATVYRIDRGDRLKVTVFGRDDLSREYLVDENGQIRVPTLGAFEAVDRRPTDVETAIMAALERALQRPGFVSIDVIERRPVFVTGLVAKPGAYTFAPGMTAMQAVALAGGTSPFARGSFLPTEALRESGRIRSAQEELKQLIARRARLKAEQSGKAEIDMPAELVELSGEAHAADLIHQETAVLRHQLEAMTRDQTSLSVAINTSHAELAAYEKELGKIGEQRQLREQALEQVKTLALKGLTTQQRLTDMQILIASIDRDAQTAIGSIARSRRSIERAERDLAMLKLERNVKVEQELQGIGDQIAKLNVAIEGSARVVEQITSLPSSLLTFDSDHVFRYEVVRKQPAGKHRTLDISETTTLLPGDVLKVLVRRSS